MTTDLLRRKILTVAPLAAAGALLANPIVTLADALRSGHAAAADAAAVKSNKTLVTYYQVPMQKRWPVNEKLVSNKPYSKYFTKDLVVPLAMVEAQEAGPLTGKHLVPPTIDGLKTMLSDFSTAPVSGYALIEEGPCAYAQSRHVFPGVTAKMFEWWFTWHPIESERYMLWFPYAHIHNSVEDPVRLANSKLTYGERLYNNPNHITEIIGNMYLDGYINFDTPESFGVDKASYESLGFSFNASGIITTLDAPDTPLALMIHMGRDTPAGLEMINRYWIGTHDSWDRFKKFPGGAAKSKALIKKMGMDREVLENFAYEMALHDMTEFTCLAGFLPAIYKENNPLG